MDAGEPPDALVNAPLLVAAKDVTVGGSILETADVLDTLTLVSIGVSFAGPPCHKGQALERRSR